MFVGFGEPSGGPGLRGSHSSSKEAEFVEIPIGVDVAEGIEVEGFGALDPEGVPVDGAEVPVDYFAGPGV